MNEASTVLQKFEPIIYTVALLNNFLDIKLFLSYAMLFYTLYYFCYNVDLTKMKPFRVQLIYF